MVGDSAQSFITIFAGLLGRISGGGKGSWLGENVKRLGPPLAHMSQGMVAFITFNLLVNSIPESCSWTVPKLLRFCDINGDGTLDAEEIEQVTYDFSSRALGCFVVWQVARFLHSVRKPPRKQISEDAKGWLSRYFRALQRSKRREGRTRESRKANIGIWFTDAALATTIWVGTLFTWMRILGVPYSAVAAAMAPLGIGGLAFSLAAKNIVQNLISGVLIFINQAFVEGDEIHSLDGKVRGVVSKVGLINTEVLRLAGDPVTIPNTDLVSNGIVNLQRRDFWLIDQAFQVYLPSFEQLRDIVEAMDVMLKEKVAHEALPVTSIKSFSVYEEPVCFFEGFGHQGATIRARAYVDGAMPRHRFYEVRSKILLALSDVAFSFRGAGIGFEAHIVSPGVAPPGGLEAGHGDHGHGGGHAHAGGHGEGHGASAGGHAAKGKSVNNHGVSDGLPAGPH